MKIALQSIKKMRLSWFLFWRKILITGTPKNKVVKKYSIQ